MAIADNQKRTKLLPFLFFLTLAFAMTEISGYLMTSQGAILIFVLIKKQTLKVPANVLWGQLWFLLVQIALHIIYTLLIWMQARLLGFLFKCNWALTCRIGFTLWLLSTLTVIFANQALYPASGFALLTATVFPAILAVVFMWLGAIILGIVGMLSIVAMLKFLWQKGPVLKLAAAITCGGVYLFYADITKVAVAQTLPSMQQQQLPNVIIIGIDSLRTDYTDFGGYQGGEQLTPNLDSFLQNATIFNNAFTPIARTFPSWTAILTGLYPIHNGARSNLAYQAPLKLQNTIGNLLQQAGYTTVYATDDRRFSNISHTYGFHKLIGPLEGANDFVLGAINDLPLSNLIVNVNTIY